MYDVNALYVGSKRALEQTIEDLNDMINNFGKASVGDLYDLFGRTSTYEDTKYGWTTPIEPKVSEEIYTNFGVTRFRVILPPAERIDNVPHDMVQHPIHYQTRNGFEVIDVIEAFTEDLTGIEATDTGNIIKYACRWKKKNGVEDLKKLIWYADHLVRHLESNQVNSAYNEKGVFENEHV